MDQDLRDLKIQHLKGRADQALQEGNNKLAYTKYAEALALKPNRDTAKRLLCNRSLAYSKALRYAEALADAEQAISLAPSWEKAHYRKGAALMGLKEHPEAALAFKNAWQLNPGNMETSKKLRAAVHALTREEVAGGILLVLGTLRKRGDLQPATVEALTAGELLEAAFCIIKSAHQQLPKAKPYHEQYLRWLKSGVPVGEAYTQRAAIYAAAKCFLQAQADAKTAIGCYQSAGEGLGPEDRSTGLACAYLRLGEALLADPKHADRDCCQAVKAFAKGLELDAGNVDLQEGAKAARLDLTLEELHQVQHELQLEGCQSLGGVARCAAQIAITLQFPLAAARRLDATARRRTCAATASLLGVPAGEIQVEGIRKCDPGLEMTLAAAVAGDDQRIEQVLAGCKGAASFGNELEDILGPCKVLDAHLVQEKLSGSNMAGGYDCPAADRHTAAQEVSTSRELTEVPRPKQEIALPYMSYRLVTAEGQGVERLDKHPFCMSRIYYSRSERPAEVWAQHADGCCRWRQTGSEVKVIALKVPAGISAKQLSVTLEPFHVKVARKDGSEVYLEGSLERGIVPQESVWTHGGGTGEDGLLLLLHKMNLELLQRHWLHSEMWWPRVFKGAPEIAWDDYEKDYSDLPAPVLAAHAAVEAEKEAVRQLEAKEKSARQLLQDGNEARRRRRLERLKAMKPTTFIAWSHLQHALATCS